MDYLFYENAGRFGVGRIMQSNEATWQIETYPDKRRIKVRRAMAFFEFNQAPDAFLEQAKNLQETIDIDLLWQSCEGEMTAAQLAQEYFGQDASRAEEAAILMALHQAPMYFQKKTRGLFRPAPAEILKQALATMEKRRQEEQQITAWADALIAGQLPEALQTQIQAILHAPDKQSLGYKAFMRAADQLNFSPLALARHVHAVDSMADYLLEGFLHSTFPYPRQAPDLPIPWTNHLPIADGIKAFSIDSDDTTEIDDALSLVPMDNGNFRLGIHIAAPTLAVADADAAEKMIFQRLSTVYYPSGKIPMLPATWIQTFSLDEGDYRPALSIYFTLNLQGDFIGTATTRLEQVYIDHNLRIEKIEPYFSRHQGLTLGEPQAFAHHDDLRHLYRLAQALRQKRQRAPAENAPIRYEYSLKVNPHGEISRFCRERDSTIDTLVSEMMILANSTWAGMLDQAQLGAIFRVQPAATKVRFATKAAEHDGMGVKQYAWLTSPLRRAVDFFNQRQLLYLIGHRDKPRFLANDVELFGLLRDFESAKTAYDDLQQQLERYWSLVYLKQHAIQQLTAFFVRGDIVRIEGLPLTTRALGMPFDLAPQTRVLLRISEIDADALFIGLAYINVAADALPSPLDTTTE